MGRSRAPVTLLRRRSVGAPTDTCAPPAQDGLDPLASPTGASTRLFKAAFGHLSSNEKKPPLPMPSTQPIEVDQTKVPRSISLEVCASDSIETVDEKKGFLTRRRQSSLPMAPTQPIARRRSVGAPTDACTPSMMQVSSLPTEDKLDPLASPTGSSTRSFKNVFTRRFSIEKKLSIPSTRPIGRRRSVGSPTDSHEPTMTKVSSLSTEDGVEPLASSTGVSSHSFRNVFAPIARRRSVGAPTDTRDPPMMHVSSLPTEDGVDPLASPTGSSTRSFRTVFARRTSIEQKPPLPMPPTQPITADHTTVPRSISLEQCASDTTATVEENKGFFTRRRQSSLEKVPPTLLRISSAPMNAGSLMVSTMSKLKRVVATANSKNDSQEEGEDDDGIESGGEQDARESLVQLLAVPDRQSYSQLPLMAADLTDY